MHCVFLETQVYCKPDCKKYFAKYMKQLSSRLSLLLQTDIFHSSVYFLGKMAGGRRGFQPWEH